jgi:hypothetical protein
MAVRALTAAVFVPTAAGTINLAISDCGDAATHGHVAGISPTSVKQGSETVVTGSGHLDTTVSDGSFDVNVKAAGVSLQKCRGDLCSPSKCSLPAGTGHVNFQGVACPLAAGDVSLDFDVKVSRFVPSSLAHLDIEIESEGSAGKLLCAKIATSPGAVEEEEFDEEEFDKLQEEESDEMLGGKINLAISDCGDDATHGHVSSISPSYVTKGKKSVVTGTGHLDTTVTDGSFDFDIKFGDMSVHKCTGDICGPSKCSFPMGTGSIVYHGLNCPVAEGDVTMDFDVRVSRIVPKEFETLTIELRSKGSAGNLLCAKIATSPGAMDEEISV